MKNTALDGCGQGRSGREPVRVQALKQGGGGGLRNF